MTDEEGKASATSRLEWFVVGILHKLTRSDVDECLRAAHDSSGSPNDSYAAGTVAALIGDWRFSRYVDSLVASRHECLLTELSASRDKLETAERKLRDLTHVAQKLRKTADMLDPQEGKP